jgi:hypothetical protein
MLRSGRLRHALAAACLALSLSPELPAQELEPSTEAAAESDGSARGTKERSAVRLGHDGLALYEASRWNEAHDRYRAAERLVHSPVFLLYMARCRRNVGKLLEAAQQLERLSHERVPEDAPTAWHGAIADAYAELIALRRSIPRVVIVLSDAPDARVRLDGRELPSSSLGKSLDLDPGRHTLVARSKGRKLVRSFAVSQGQATTRLEVSFATTNGPGDSKAPERDSTSTWRTAGFVLLGVGAAGLGFGAGAAVVAADRDRDDDWGAWSTVSLTAGGTVAAAGVLLLALNPGHD